MKRRTKLIVGGLGLALLAGGGFVLWLENSHLVDRAKIEPSRLDLLADDKLEDKTPEFDPTIVDSRLMEEGGTKFELNASAAVLKLDIRETRTDEPELNTLYASYADAAQALETQRLPILPSINSVDGMAKQFDDAVMAAVSQWLLSSALENEFSVSRLVSGLRSQLKPGDAAYDWASVAAHFGGVVTEGELTPKQRARVEEFSRRTVAKPLGFYTWTKDLRRVWAFLKFLQQRMDDAEIENVASLLRSDSELKKGYLNANEWVRKVSAPAGELHLLAGGVRFLPPAETKEDVLFGRLFGIVGVPVEVELMHTLIQAIRSGEIDLAPRMNGGWYDRQVYALETFLLPSRGQESSKLLLTKKYKHRLLEAFKATITKRRETHVGFQKYALGFAVLDSVNPRLRVEPNPTYFLRMARSYRYVDGVLRNVFDSPTERKFGDKRDLGLRKDGRRERPLTEEVVWMRRLFYGLHLVSCEDIGLQPFLEPAEVDWEQAMKVALEYLEQWREYPDMKADVRVSVPLFRQQDGYRMWCNLGIKAVKLRVSYARLPSLRIAGGDGEWHEAVSATESDYLLLVDDFAELHRSSPMNRAELRAVCNRFATREEIIAELQ